MPRIASKSKRDNPAKLEYKVELANKIVRGRAVGNLYGVAEYVNGRRRGWVLEPQESEKKARDLVKKMRQTKSNPRKKGWTKDLTRLSKYGEVYRQRVGDHTVVVRAIFQAHKGDSYHVRVLKGAGLESDERKRGNVLWRDDFYIDTGKATPVRSRAIAAGKAQASKLSAKKNPTPRIASGSKRDNPARGSLKLWSYNRITGYWDYVRTIEVEKDAPEWKRVFERSEPQHQFKLSRTKPKGKPTIALASKRDNPMIKPAKASQLTKDQKSVLLRPESAASSAKKLSAAHSLMAAGYLKWEKPKKYSRTRKGDALAKRIDSGGKRNPASAVDSLRAAENKIRSGATGATSDLRKVVDHLKKGGSRQGLFQLHFPPSVQVVASEQKLINLINAVVAMTDAGYRSWRKSNPSTITPRGKRNPKTTKTATRKTTPKKNPADAGRMAALNKLTRI